MPRPLLASLSLLLAASALSGPARAACVGARLAPGVSGQPAPWRRAAEDLARSTAEPGHPWSCTGGEINLVASPPGALLIVRREGESWITRPVGSPGEVLPLGQALLARPVGPDEPEEPAVAPPAPAPVEAPAVASAAPSTPPALVAPAHEPRLLVGAALDGRYAGPSRVAWVGPTIAAGVPVGAWLPQIVVRYQAAVASRGKPIDDLAVGAALLRRWRLAGLELRAGGRVGVGLVVRDLPRPAGAQARLDGRIGLLAAVVVPLWSSLRLVIAVDGEGMPLARTIGNPGVAGDPRAFPAWTLGGSAGVELAL